MRSTDETPECCRLAVVGAGRLGQALLSGLRSARLRSGGLEVVGPLDRGADGDGFDAVLLCVPDAEIAAAAELIAPGRLVGHCSGATGLEVLAPHEAFSLHPLMTVTDAGATFAGAGAAVAGATPRGLDFAWRLARALGMEPVEVAPADRAAYHAAASIASNFLITLEAGAEQLAATAGVDRRLLVPLVRATVENWAALGGEAALTGPVARGDEATVSAQREAVEVRAPELIPLFDTLVEATQALARREHPGGRVNTVRTVAGLRAALDGPRRAGRRIGLVPTMGAFHEGHLSLMRRAREECDVVVVSLFVNPAQFNEATDLEAYPRDEARDGALAAEIGVDLLFAPPVSEVYPDGFATAVSVAGITDELEGAHRGRAHFDGVATVVTKLFNMVGPQLAYFGQKDVQQAHVIQRLVGDLDLPVRIRVCPTVREADGLAMSSRNALLRPGERERATSLHRALSAAQSSLAGGERDVQAVRAVALAELNAAGVETEYFELVSAETLAPIWQVDGPVLAVVAARVGGIRLIDNQMLSTDGAGVTGPQREAKHRETVRCIA